MIGLTQLARRTLRTAQPLGHKPTACSLRHMHESNASNGVGQDGPRLVVRCSRPRRRCAPTTRWQLGIGSQLLLLRAAGRKFAHQPKALAGTEVGGGEVMHSDLHVQLGLLQDHGKRITRVALQLEQSSEFPKGWPPPPPPETQGTTTINKSGRMLSAQLEPSLCLPMTGKRPQ